MLDENSLAGNGFERAMAKQQNLGIEQVSLSMSSINRATSDALEAIRASERTARELAALSQRLTELLDGLGGGTA